MRELRRRAALARKHVSSPGDLVLMARMCAWAFVLPVLKYVVPLQRLVRLAAAAGEGPRHRAREEKVESFARIVYHSSASVLRDNCLERSLVAYRYLGRANADPELVIGMGKDDRRFLGHVWVTVDGTPLYDTPEQLAEFQPVVVFDASGATKA